MSITLVCVYPVINNALIGSKKLKESLFCKEISAFDGVFKICKKLLMLTIAPAAPVGPSVPSVPAESITGQCFAGRPKVNNWHNAAKANSWLRPPLPVPRMVTVVSPPAKKQAGRLPV